MAYQFHTPQFAEGGKCAPPTDRCTAQQQLWVAQQQLWVESGTSPARTPSTPSKQPLRKITVCIGQQAVPTQRINVEYRRSLFTAGDQSVQDTSDVGLCTQPSDVVHKRHLLVSPAASMVWQGCMCEQNMRTYQQIRASCCDVPTLDLAQYGEQEEIDVCLYHTVYQQMSEAALTIQNMVCIPRAQAALQLQGSALGWESMRMKGEREPKLLCSPSRIVCCFSDRLCYEFQEFA